MEKQLSSKSKITDHKRGDETETEVDKRKRTIVANFWDKFANTFHGHQVYGMENIPSNSPVILLWYHGPVPVDYMSLVAKIYLRDGKMINSVVHKSLTGNLLSRDTAKLLELTSGGRSYYVDKLKKGEIVGVAVGGAEEACFDFDYNTEWGSRTGFANVALEAGVPIIPIFTENIREAYNTIRTGETHEITKYGIHSFTQIALAVDKQLTYRQDSAPDWLNKSSRQLVICIYRQ